MLSPLLDLLLAALIALPAACASTPTPAPPTGPHLAPRPAEAPPELPPPAKPLPPTVRPTRYALSLDIDPNADRFRGSVTIDVTLATATRDLALNARGLRLVNPRVRAGSLEHSLVPFQGRHGVMVLRAPTPLPAGPAVLQLDFEGDLVETPVGLYKVADGDAWYAFTQFEAMDARRAFPCFDQPDLKAPFSISLRVPRGMTALSNGREVAREDAGGHTRFTFAETPPLPTYLVAFAVGDFAIRSAPPSAAGVPIRVVTTRGGADFTDYAAAQAAPVVDALVDWFGTPFPFEKLDLVAVPNFAAGAMENAGLVTFREEALLVAPDAPRARRARVLGTMAHELAHMWFGDLVTMAWWDDIWLNEAFATWMSWKITARVAPELEIDVGTAGWRAWAMSADARVSARAIRQPIASLGDIRNAFDAITYVKGANVLGMLERWLGADVVRRGVQAYMAARPYGTGTTGDLIAALEAAAPQDVAAVASSWLDRPGSPLVDVTLDCRGGGSGALKLRQRRYFAEGPRPVETPWRIPFCVRYPDGAGLARECILFDAVEATVPLAGARCPRWLVPNDEVRGFYRVRPSDRDLDALLADPDVLTPREQIALLGELEALVVAGELTPRRLAAAVEQLAPTRHPEVLGAVGRGLGFLRRLTPPAERDRFARWAARALAPHRALLRAPLPEPGVDELTRHTLSLFVGVAEDPDLRALSIEVADRLLDAIEGGDAGGPSAEAVDLYLRIAPRATPSEAREALWSRLAAALPKARSPIERTALIAALGRFEDPALLRRSLELLLDGTLRSQDYRTLTGAIGRERETAETVWAWLTERFDALMAKLGSGAGAGFPWLAAGFCDGAGGPRVRAFFEGQRAKIPSGLDRNLAGAIEAIDSCARLNERAAAGWARWLGTQRR